MSITATAIYANGMLKLLKPLALPENARVRVHIEPESGEIVVAEDHVLYDLFALAIDLGVDDLAEQHDHYLYGVEKR